jgi:glycosyltransferase involved in cell wall biosynthesis
LLVTTIIPAYNAEKTLGRAIESVLSQNIPSSELIVVDDGSTDQTGRVARRYKKIRVVRKKNQGVSVARNLGIEMARGKYIAFLDSDDQWLPGKLEHQLRIFGKYPKVMVVSTGVNYLGQRGEKIRVARKENRGMVFKDLLEGNYIAISSAAVRKECLRSIARPFFPAGIFYGEDYVLWMKLAAKFNFYASPEVLVNYWLPTNESFLRKFSVKNMELAYGILTGIAEARGDGAGIRKLRSKLHWELSSIHARRGDWTGTFLETAKALRHFFWSPGGALWLLENSKLLMRDAGRKIAPGHEKKDAEQ